MMNHDEKAKIAEDAQRAVDRGDTPNDACPWPFGSDHGRHWVASFLVMGGKRDELRGVL
jgi:hypothetical protein